jgi:hypothetical protein
MQAGCPLSLGSSTAWDQWVRRKPASRARAESRDLAPRLLFTLQTPRVPVDASFRSQMGSVEVGGQLLSAGPEQGLSRACTGSRRSGTSTVALRGSSASSSRAHLSHAVRWEAAGARSLGTRAPVLIAGTAPPTWHQTDTWAALLARAESCGHSLWDFACWVSWPCGPQLWPRLRAALLHWQECMQSKSPKASIWPRWAAKRAERCSPRPQRDRDV